jgi:hypothetical protein
MVGIIDRVLSVLMLKRWRYRSEITGSELIKSAHIERGDEGQLLTLELKERAQDGNDIAYVGLISGGQRVYGDEIHSGESAIVVGFTNYDLSQLSYDVIIYDSEERILDSGKLKMEQTAP